MLTRREAGEAVLSLVAGMLIALLGWTGVRRLTANPLDSLVLGATEPAGRWTIALIFRAKECPSRMALLDDLNRVKSPRVQVQGLLVVNQGEFSNWKDLVRASQITFPVRTVSPASATRALGSAQTPTLAVFDPRGHLRVLTSLTDQRLSSEIVAQIINLSTRPLEGT